MNDDLLKKLSDFDIQEIVKHKVEKPRVAEFNFLLEDKLYDLGQEATRGMPAFGGVKSIGARPKISGELRLMAPVSPKPTTFEEALEELLKVKYENVEIQSIKRQETTRIPIYIVAFTHGSKYQQKLSYMYIKDYKDNETAKQKDIILPIFLNDLGIPVAKVLGHDPKNGEFKHRYACSQLTKNGVFIDNIGQEDFSNIVNILGAQKLVECESYIAKLIAEMHVRATKHIGQLKSKYSLDLEETDYERLARERFLDHLDADPKYKEGFIRAYKQLVGLEKGNNSFFSHGDLTTNNIRRGETLSDYFFIDFELARKGAYPPEDLEMLTMFTLSLRIGDRDGIKTHLRGNRAVYFDRFNELAQKEAPELTLNPEDFATQIFIEELRGHLYKIGDQIWTQKRFGENYARKSRSQWHLDTFLDVLDNEINICHDTQKTSVLKDMRKAALELLENSKNIGYLQYSEH